jgi:hypothetical protein
MNGTRVVRIPPTPALFLRLCQGFTELAACAEVRGDPWPQTLDEWSDLLEQRDTARWL